jgi:hypothetical protein
MAARDSFTTIIRNPTGIPINKNGHDGSLGALMRTPIQRFRHHFHSRDDVREFLGPGLARRDTLARMHRFWKTCPHVGDFS